MNDLSAISDFRNSIEVPFSAYTNAAKLQEEIKQSLYLAKNYNSIIKTVMPSAVAFSNAASAAKAASQAYAQVAKPSMANFINPTIDIAQTMKPLMASRDIQVISQSVSLLNEINNDSIAAYVSLQKALNKNLIPELKPFDTAARNQMKQIEKKYNKGQNSSHSGQGDMELDAVIKQLQNPTENDETWKKALTLATEYFDVIFQIIIFFLYSSGISNDHDLNELLLILGIISSAIGKRKCKNK